MSSITLPNNWEPLPHQLPFFGAMDAGVLRADLCWHRRSGKDSSCLNYTAKRMFQQVGNYWHMLPTQRQARKAIWNGIDREGRKIIDQAFPKELRKRQDGTEMFIETVNGSTWQLCGSDNYDNLVGSNPIGVVFSEWSLCDPKAWDYLRPILAENGGWAVFIYTARGKNHAYKMHEMASKNDRWYSSFLTVEDTHRPTGERIITEQAVEDERNEGVSEEIIRQEYYCDFDVGMPGAYYVTQLRKARDEGRVCNVKYDPALPVHTAWDLGIGDAMSIWFAQLHGPEVRLIDYYQNSGEGLAHYISVLSEKGYNYDTHIAPHDIRVRELGSGKSRLETARSLGIDFDIAPQLSVDDGIEAVRNMLANCWFDEESCDLGLAALGSYRKDYDEKAQDFKVRPVHDWSSHGADAFRYLAVSSELLGSVNLMALYGEDDRQVAGSWQS